MKREFFTLVFILLTFCGFSQNNAVVELKRNSVLYIHGATNLLSFTLEQYGDKILNKKISLTAKQMGNRLYLSENQLSISIKNFKSDNLIAQNEFYKLMMIDKFPNLNLHLLYFESLLTDKFLFQEGNALINIIITGVSKRYEIPVTSSRKGDIITLTGKKKMTIKDFGLVPPTALLGLVKVSEWIEIDFHLFCKVSF